MNACRPATLAVFLSLAAARADLLARKPDPIAAAPSHFAKLDDMRIHYKSLGQGDAALVLVHGWTCDMTSWRYQVPTFEGKTRVILLDLPGHGRSDKPKIDYTPDVFARAVAAVLDDAGVKKAVLVGHSMGTPVVLRFCGRYPDRTQALVAVDGLLRRPAVKPAELEKFLGRFEGPGFEDHVHQMFRGMFTERSPARVRDEVLALVPTAPQQAAVSAMRNMFDERYWQKEKIPVPLLAVVARKPLGTPEYEKAVRELSADGDLRIMDGVGHFLMMEKPEEFNRIVAEFLARHHLPGRTP